MTAANVNGAADGTGAADMVEVRRKLLIADVGRAMASNDTAAAVAATRKLHELACGEAPDDTTAIDSAWMPLPAQWLSEAPPARRWLLRHPTSDGMPCAPGEGDGLLPLGKAGVLAAEGGAGKTHVLVGLAIAIITSRAWLGHFYVPSAVRCKRVLLLVAEEDAEEAHRRVWDAARALGLDEAERARLVAQLVILPLHSKPCALLHVDQKSGTITETAELAALRRLLAENAGEHGWAFVGLDPLSRLAACEGSNEVATRFLQVLESLTEAPGNPTVIVAHHSSKESRRAGSVDARGVTGITDAARWEGTLRVQGEDVYFKQAKSNYSIPWRGEELRLVRERGGVLRAATEVENAAREAAFEETVVTRTMDKSRIKEAAKDAARAERLAEHTKRVVAAASRGWLSIRELALKSGLDVERASPAVHAAVADGRLVAGSPVRGHDRYALPGGGQ